MNGAGSGRSDRLRRCTGSLEYFFCAIIDRQRGSHLYGTSESDLLAHQRSLLPRQTGVCAYDLPRNDKDCAAYIVDRKSHARWSSVNDPWPCMRNLGGGGRNGGRLSWFWRHWPGRRRKMPHIRETQDAQWLGCPRPSHWACKERKDLHGRCAKRSRTRDTVWPRRKKQGVDGCEGSRQGSHVSGPKDCGNRMWVSPGFLPLSFPSSFPFISPIFPFSIPQVRRRVPRPERRYPDCIPNLDSVRFAGHHPYALRLRRHIASCSPYRQLLVISRQDRQARNQRIDCPSPSPRKHLPLRCGKAKARRRSRSRARLQSTTTPVSPPLPA